MADADRDGVAERNWMCMIGEAACEGFVTASIRPSKARMARTFSCNVLKINGVFHRMFMPSEAETARSAGAAAEKTNDVPLTRLLSTTVHEPAQNPPDGLRPFATKTRSMSIWVACASSI